MRTAPFDFSPLKQLAQKIASGYKDFTAEELQMQQTYPKELEEELKKLQTPNPKPQTEPDKQPNIQTVKPATQTNWLVTIILVLVAVAAVYFFMKSKIPVVPVV